MNDDSSQKNHVRQLFLDAITYWRLRSSNDDNTFAYDLLVASSVVVELLIDMPPNPEYWSIKDASMIRVCITRLQEMAEVYHLRKQAEDIAAKS